MTTCADVAPPSNDSFAREHHTFAIQGKRAVASNAQLKKLTKVQMAGFSKVRVSGGKVRSDKLLYSAAMAVPLESALTHFLASIAERITAYPVEYVRAGFRSMRLGKRLKIDISNSIMASIVSRANIDLAFRVENQAHSTVTFSLWGKYTAI